MGKTVKIKAEAADEFHTLVNIADQKGIDVKVNSGYRTVEHQSVLWNQALKKYGSATTARKWVAPPGKSQHNNGIALDIAMYKNGKKVSQNEFDKVIAQAGFYRPMSYEGWHIEPIDTAYLRNKNINSSNFA